MMEGPGADSEEKQEPASDIDTALADSLKALDLKRPIREADMARTLPEGDPRYATDFLPRTDGAGCSPGGGGASGSWWPWPRLCQELRTQKLAGVLWPTWRRFDPSSSPSARPAGAAFSPSDLHGSQAQ